MTSEGSGGNELAELVADHILSDINGNMLAAVMDGNGMAHEGGENGRGSGPGLENLLLAAVVELLNALEELRRNKRAFFNASRHVLFLLTSNFCA